MTIKEAILKSLEEIIGFSNSTEICNYILEKKYYDFAGKTPSATISAQLGEFIRNGDTRVKRIKQDNGTYSYYLAKNEQIIGLEVLTGTTENSKTKTVKIDKNKTYDERDLHKLLSSYLKNSSIYSKTIFHEQSNGKDNNQNWTHPDMVGIKFLNLQTKIKQEY